MKFAAEIGHLDFVAALGTEFRAGIEFGAALGAFILRAQRLAALGTELCSLRSRAAGRTQRRRLAGQVKVLGQVLLPQLVFHLVHGSLHLRGRQFRLDVWSAVVAEHPLGIPAGIQADPVRAFGALAEIGFGFLDGVTKSLVVRGTQHGALDLIGAAARSAQHSAEEAASSVQRAGGHAGGGSLEFAHEAVAATVTEKFELKSFVGGMVSVVPCELDECHVGFVLLRRRAEIPLILTE